MTINQIIIICLLFFSVFFGFSLGLFFAIRSARKEDKELSESEHSDILILKSIINVYSDPSLHLSFYSDSSEFSDAFDRFKRVKNRLTSQEIEILVKIFYFVDDSV